VYFLAKWVRLGSKTLTNILLKRMDINLMPHHLNQVMQHAGAPENPQYISPRAIYWRGKMNTNTCLIGSSLVNNVNLLENVWCTCKGSWKPRRWMLNENIVEKMVSLLVEFSMPIQE
jgi:hypothetical protein